MSRQIVRAHTHTHALTDPPARPTRRRQVSAAKGDGVLFWDYAPHQTDATDAVEVDGSQHSGCPVVKGEKWIVTRWIRSSEFI